MRYKKDFEISNEFYWVQTIKAWIDVFSVDFDIKYKNWVVTISWDENNDINLIFLEFMNYLVYLIVSN